MTNREPPGARGVTVSGGTRLLAVVGHPISHSLSPAMHNASFVSTGQDYLYVPLDVKPNNLTEAVRGLAATGFAGFNVTMPHKEAVTRLVDELDLTAEVSGAVNTVVIPPDGEPLLGMNTDGGGFIEAASEAGIAFRGKTAVFVGAGGAAAAIATAAIKSGCDEIRLVNRGRGRAERLAERLVERFAADVSVLGSDRISEAVHGADVVVNTTYLGMGDADDLPVPQGLIGPGIAVCDVVYRRDSATRLVRVARDAGCSVMEGGSMLLFQGVLAQRAWTGVEPDVAAMRDALRAGRSD